MAAHLFTTTVTPGRRLSPVELAEAVDIAQNNDGSNQLAPRVATVLRCRACSATKRLLSGTMIQTRSA